jgi:hypothetical protein
MPANLAQLRVDGLTSLQLAELQAAIATTGKDYVTTLDSPSLGGGKVGEPTLLTVVITLGPAVISAIALWACEAEATAHQESRVREDQSRWQHGVVHDGRIFVRRGRVIFGSDSEISGEEVRQ